VKISFVSLIMHLLATAGSALLTVVPVEVYKNFGHKLPQQNNWGRLMALFVLPLAMPVALLICLQFIVLMMAWRLENPWIVTAAQIVTDGLALMFWYQWPFDRSRPQKASEI
jgi:hypothetical protein